MDNLNAALYRATTRIEAQLDGPAAVVYQIATSAQWGAYGFAADALTGGIFRPSSTVRCADRAVDQTREAALAVTASSAAAIQQARNTLAVYDLVKKPEPALRDSGAALDQLVALSYTQGSFPAIWAVEGLGQEFCRRRWPDKLAEFRSAIETLPAQALSMLHAGLGLAAADEIMADLTPYDDERRLREGLARFLEICENYSRPGYSACAVESLGLVTRTWHPRNVRRVDKTLQAIAPRAVPYFWHGAGRALYFAAPYLLQPFNSPWSAADSESPHAEGRRNMRAGLAWATTLVNMRNPSVLEALLKARGRQLLSDDAPRNGVAGCATMGFDTLPGHPGLAELASWRPADSRLARDWESLFAEPLRSAREIYQPVLRTSGRLDEAFREQPLFRLCAMMRSSAATLRAGGTTQ